MDTDFMNTALLENKLNPKCWWKEPVRNGVTDPVCLKVKSADRPSGSRRSAHERRMGPSHRRPFPGACSLPLSKGAGRPGARVRARTSMSADLSSTAITVRIIASTAGSGPEIRTQAATGFPPGIFYPAAKAATRWVFVPSSFRAEKIHS